MNSTIPSCTCTRSNDIKYKTSSSTTQEQISLYRTLPLQKPYKQEVHQHHFSQLTKMGKKSRRQKTGKDEIAVATRTLLAFNQIAIGRMQSNSEDEEQFNLAKKKLLDYEPKVLDAIPKVKGKQGYFSSNDRLSVIYCNLGSAYLPYYYYGDKVCLDGDFVAKPDECDKAISYFNKAKELDSAIDTTTGLHRYEADIIDCYVKFDRSDEAMIAFKEGKLRLRDHPPPIIKDFRLVENFVLSIANQLRDKGEHKHACDILNLVSDEIERCWGAPSQKLAFGILTGSSGSQKELQNEIMYCEKLHYLVHQQQHEFEAPFSAGMILGILYRKCCKYHIAMHHLQSALAFWKKSKSKDCRRHIIDIYIEMGWVYLDYGFGHEQNAMQVFGRALSKTKRISNAKKEGPSAKALRGIGIAYYDLGDWGRAIIAFENSLVACNEAEGHIYLGYVYLEKCLRLPPDTDGYVRADVMDCALGHDMMNQYKKLSKIGVSMALYSESEGIFLGVKLEVLRRNIDGAKTSIKQLFDTEINGYDDDVVYCHCCNQRHGESVELKKCAGCKVRYYCSKRHQKDKWRGRFIDHRMLCPYLNRWRRVKRRMKKEERSRDTLDSILNDFVEVIERVYINKYGVFIPGK